jgi:hypothetical protein
MVTNNYYLEYIVIAITSSGALICGILYSFKKYRNNEYICNNIEEMLKEIQNIKFNNDIYLSKITGLQIFLDTINVYTRKHLYDLDIDNNKLITYIKHINDEVKFVQTNMNESFKILAKPILHFAEIEPKIKDIINSKIKSIDEFSEKFNVDNGVYQGWIGNSRFEDYSLEITIVKKELKTFHENLLWIDIPINPESVNWLVKTLFNNSFSPFILPPFHYIKWDSIDNTMTLTSKIYEYNGSTDITMKFTLTNLPEDKSNDVYKNLTDKSEDIFKNIVWEHTLVDI